MFGVYVSIFISHLVILTVRLQGKQHVYKSRNPLSGVSRILWSFSAYVCSLTGSSSFVFCNFWERGPPTAPKVPSLTIVPYIYVLPLPNRAAQIQHFRCRTN